jgi:hypothetical protein
MPNASPLKTIRRLRAVFFRPETIIASWRTCHGRKLGPYYRLAYPSNSGPFPSKLPVDPSG